MMTCRSATRLLSEKQDRKLTLAERLSLRAHLLLCDGCRNFGTQMKALRRFLRGYVDGEDQSAANRAASTSPKRD